MRVKWKRQEHFFHDGNFRGDQLGATMMKLNAVLAAWGLPRLPEVGRSSAMLMASLVK